MIIIPYLLPRRRRFSQSVAFGPKKFTTVRDGY